MMKTVSIIFILIASCSHVHHNLRDYRNACIDTTVLAYGDENGPRADCVNFCGLSSEQGRCGYDVSEDRARCYCE